MKIIHILSGLSTGGAERMLVKLIKQTKDIVEHVVISLSDEGEQGYYIKKMEIPLITLELSGAIQSLFSVGKLRKIIVSQDADIIQAWMYNGNLAAILACRSLNIPVVYNVRHSLHNIRSEKKTMQATIRLNTFYSKRAAAIVYNSKVSRKQHEEFGFSSRASIIIPNGFDVDLYKKSQENRLFIREYFKIPENAFLFAQIGRNHPMKNHRGFIEAAIKTIQKANRKDIYFLVVGMGVGSDLELQKLIRESKTEDKILLSDQRPDIEKVWSAADCGVLSSSWGEGFPNVVGEAMACENLCIVTDIGDSAFIVGDCGIVVQPNNIKDMSDSMVRMLRVPEGDFYAKSRQARKRIVDYFSIEKIAAQYLELYNDIIINQ